MRKINFILLLFAVMLVAGCGKSAEETAVKKQIEKATGGDADVDLSGEGMTITSETEDGSFTVTAGSQAKIPEGFPSDVFIYTPSKVIMGMKTPKGFSIALSTPDSSSKVKSAYKTKMTAGGWAEEASMDLGGQSVLIYKKSNKTANIAIGSTDKELMITLTIITEK